MNMPEDDDRAFSPIAQSVERFAANHSLRLEKCARANAGWELTRPHEPGGNVSLLLLYDDHLGLGIGSVWKFPCPEMSTLYSHFLPMLPCRLEPEAVIAALDSEL
jgi:hypothetical protein